MPVMLETPAELYLPRNFSISASMMEGLNRINQAGAERAQEALAGFLGHDTKVGIETISILPLVLLAQRLRRPGTEYLGCHVRIFGEIQAELYCYLKSRDAKALVSAVLHRRFYGKALNPLELSALAEMTNVLANSYWLALHGHIPLNWRTTVPTPVTRIERLFSLASRIGHYDSLVFHTELALRESGLRVYFCLIPGVDCLNRLLKSLDAEHLHLLVN